MLRVQRARRAAANRCGCGCVRRGVWLRPAVRCGGGCGCEPRAGAVPEAGNRGCCLNGVFFGSCCGEVVGIFEKFCGGCNGCSGEVYWSEWHNDPPRCHEPCDCCGNFTGPSYGGIRDPVRPRLSRWRRGRRIALCRRPRNGRDASFRRCNSNSAARFDGQPSAQEPGTDVPQRKRRTAIVHCGEDKPHATCGEPAPCRLHAGRSRRKPASGTGATYQR